MLENAVRICGASFGILFQVSKGTFRPAAEYNLPTAYSEFNQQRGPFRTRPGSTLDRLERTQSFVSCNDIILEDSQNPAGKFGGARSLLEVPMLKEGVLVGAIVIYRQEVRPFTEKQTVLLQNFAAQAVIAIENARLLNELRQRTADLTEALEQQTATSEVLRVISSSPGELKPVFQAILDHATRICEADLGTMFLYKNDTLTIVAAKNVPDRLMRFRESRPIRPDPRTGLGLAVRTKEVVHVLDLASEQAYLDRHPHVVASVELGGIRTLLVVPMLKDGEVIGTINIFRQKVQSFTGKQIALLQNFAAQAVIAIENARLLNELRESLEQQTATSEVLRVISSSTGELQPVFQSILENATRICTARFGNLYHFNGERFCLAAEVGAPPEFTEIGDVDGSGRGRVPCSIRLFEPDRLTTPSIMLPTPFLARLPSSVARARPFGCQC
jgi:GAF domain-containing protein